jgi:lysophospholipase L1-like esterase
MKIIEKMTAKSRDHMHHEGVTIAFLGDSVTQGCFELYKKGEHGYETVFDKKSSYEMYLFDMLCTLYPNVTVNIVNAGISGDTTKGALARLDRHVLRHAPDLTVVCFGLNDCGHKPESVTGYVERLGEIFDRVLASGSELIFMTPNMMNPTISPQLYDADLLKIAERTMDLQTGGYFDRHIDAVRALCRERSIPVCDCYAIWKKLYESGVDVTELLANKINHPTREMNRLFAIELLRTMLWEA